MARARWWQQRFGWQWGLGGACLLAFLTLSPAVWADGRDGNSQDNNSGRNGNSRNNGGGNQRTTVSPAPAASSNPAPRGGNAGVSNSFNAGNSGGAIRRIDSQNLGSGNSQMRVYQQPSNLRTVQPSGNVTSGTASGQPTIRSTNPPGFQPQNFSAQGSSNTGQPANRFNQQPNNFLQQSNPATTRQPGVSTQTLTPAPSGTSTTGSRSNLSTGNVGVGNLSTSTTGRTGGTGASGNTTGGVGNNAANLAPKLSTPPAPGVGQNPQTFSRGNSNTIGTTTVPGGQNLQNFSRGNGANNPLGTTTQPAGQTPQGTGGISDVRKRLGGGNDSRQILGGVGTPSGTNTGSTTTAGPTGTNPSKNSISTNNNLAVPGSRGPGNNLNLNAGRTGAQDNKGTAGTDQGTGGKGSGPGSDKATSGSVTGPTISGHGPTGTTAGTTTGNAGTGTATTGNTAGTGKPGDGKSDVKKLDTLDTKKLGGPDLQHRPDGHGSTANTGGAAGHTEGPGNPDNKGNSGPGPHGKTAGDLSLIGAGHGPGTLDGHIGGAVVKDHVGMPPTQLQQRVDKGELDAITKSKIGGEVKLADQYRLADTGDVARRLDLHKVALAHGPGPGPSGPGPGGPGHHDPGPPGPHPGFHHHPYFVYFGVVSPLYYHNCLEFNYWGPSWYASSVWYPQWTPWVHWCWYYHPHPVWDPRPIWCRPVIYTPAPVWVYYEPPVWTPLPEVACGTWVDVNRVVIEPERRDLQLLAVRFVDPGHPEEKLGPRYRVWFRNNGDKPIQQPFNVSLVASDEGKLRDGLPQAGVRVTAIDPGDTQSVDIRLPFEVYQMRKDAEGKPIPFSNLHVMVDANREIDETTKDNNGAVLAPADILPVDPAAFQIDPAQAAVGGEILLAGEGLGPEPGKVLVHVGATETEAEILGWYDLGVRLKVPDLNLAGQAQGELVVIRGDGAASNPLSVVLEPGKAAAALATPLAPAAEATVQEASTVEPQPTVELVPAAPPAVQ